MSPASAEAGTRFHCALCGDRFTHGDRVCHACPLRDACDVVVCPSCGYQFPRVSHIWTWIQRRLGKGAEGA
jgi:hypothetical protein